jgi:ABC-type antimicrobial peptide transport system permease subunit
VGILGVISHDVSRRTPEIGIRMALGARPVDVGAMVLRDVARLTLIGAAVGLAGAALLTRVLGSLLYEIGPHDPLTFVAVPMVIILAAGAIPARRMARLDPLRAIRTG